MADNVGYTPGTGVTVAADDIGGVLYQRVKPTFGEDGIAIDTSKSNPLPVVADQSDDLLRMLSRLVKLLESNAVVDAQNRQRVTVDSIAGTAVLAAVTTVTTVSTVASITAGTITAVNNLAANAGMDREQYINIAKNTYANAIRSQLTFV
jgi:hypothetical protein